MSNKLSKQKSIRELKTYHVGALESAAHRSLRKHKDALLNEFGLTGMQWYIVGTVADAGPAGIRTTDLAETLATTMGFLTNNVNLLVSSNILIRRQNEEDSRSSFVVMKPSYQKTYLNIEAALRKKLRKTIYNYITPEELATYIHVITKFSKL